MTPKERRNKLSMVSYPIKNGTLLGQKLTKFPGLTDLPDFCKK